MNDGHSSQVKNYIKIARPDHWIKNVFILPGLALALILTEALQDWGSFVIKLVTGFFATCFIASANYVINEWLDAEFDQYHPTKKVQTGGEPEYEIFARDGGVCCLYCHWHCIVFGGKHTVSVDGAVAFGYGCFV